MPKRKKRKPKLKTRTKRGLRIAKKAKRKVGRGLVKIGRRLSR